MLSTLILPGHFTFFFAIFFVEKFDSHEDSNLPLSLVLVIFYLFFATLQVKNKFTRITFQPFFQKALQFLLILKGNYPSHYVLLFGTFNVETQKQSGQLLHSFIDWFWRFFGCHFFVHLFSYCFQNKWKLLTNRSLQLISFVQDEINIQIMHLRKIITKLIYVLNIHIIHDFIYMLDNKNFFSYLINLIRLWPKFVCDFF